jgi:serine/threonine protein kinase
MSKLLSQGGFGCVYYPGITCNGETDKDKKYVTKLQRRDFNADNEIHIGNLISTIKNYKNFFIPVIKSCDIDLRRIDSSIVSDCQVVSQSGEVNYLLMTLNYVKNISLENTIVTSSSKEIKKRSFAQLLSMYTYLLNSIKLLYEKNIIHFDLKVDNLLFGIKLGTPLVIDFGISIPKDKLNKDSMKKYFYAFVPEYYVWPLEVHVINYLLHSTQSTLTDYDINLISSRFGESNDALLFFSKSFKERYLLSCKYQLKKYIGLDRDKVIDQLLSYNHTWDNYSLSIMFITIYIKIFKQGMYFNKMFVFFIELLVINMSPDPKLRINIDDSLYEYNKCFYIESDTNNYVNLINHLR